MLGDLQDFSLPDLFQMLNKAQKSGQLSIWTPKGIYRLGFYQGRLLTAIAPEFEKRFKSSLLAKLALSPEQEFRLPNFSSLEEPLGTVLRKTEIASAQQLAEIFRTQLQLAVYPLFELKTGQFRFASNVPIPYEEMTGLSKDALEVAMDGLRFLETNKTDCTHLPQPDACFDRVSKELPILNLSPTEWSVLERIQPSLSVREISQQLLLDLLDVRKICARLEKVGLITLRSPQPPLSPSPTVVHNQKKDSNLTLQPAVALNLPGQDSSDNKQSQGSEKVNVTLLNRLSAVLRGKR